MTTLPPGVEALTLPEPWHWAHDGIDYFAADQLHAAYAKGARAGYLAGLEAAAKEAADLDDTGESGYATAHCIADAIRALGETK